ncbi:arginine--tRNA ligase [Candidatus Pacearchaeota archaeon CG10_big_fil_rev_8_21_14_0_10_31_9]|nr:MAG: arginine--tRNA ligase [Candidatus Pacearchaeota archaeon CG1_02_32_21]PIN94298.1 MAG: arginine--tRNA ligase [Candidatus Pacearchaeota archaeon CG10_big_fil_rev_8_21_14_0_10_31_9]PIZ82743.1 MAG: arginine--tRNA ligase [Candidatus Pacearchaeota archaeon CG_4_10_14_0_2_um_filter_05_32_18]
MRDVVSDLISKNTKLRKEEIEKLIEIPPGQEMGDYAFPCFILAKTLRKNPIEASLKLSRKIGKKLPKEIQKIENKGPYLNFFVDRKILAKKALAKALSENYGSEKNGEKIIIEHTSVNPNASPHVGRSRNSIIGDSIVRILKFLGNKVEIHYYVNDVSKQIAMLALVYKKGDKFQDMLGNYIKISKKVSENPDLEKEVFDLLEKFESKDKKTVSLFKEIVGICVDGQKKIFEKFGIKFDYFDYESEYVGKYSEDLLKKIEATGKLFKDDEGRMVLDLSHTKLMRKMKSPVFVLARSNGTGLYGLRDIAYTIEKLNKIKGNKGRNIIVLGEDQKLYFEQIAESLKLLGYSSPEVVHYSFVLLQDSSGKAKKMSTRRGELVLLEDFYDETIKRASLEIKKRKTKGYPEKIAVGAIKYAMLRNDNDKNIIFSWEHSLNFEGDSGPYLQYSYARASSILKKFKAKKNAKYEIPELNESETKLIKIISSFPEVVKKSSLNLNPSVIANYSFQLAQAFNEFYHSSQVLGSEEEQFRIKLVEAFRNTLKNSLFLLGIEVMDEM